MGGGGDWRPTIQIQIFRIKRYLQRFCALFLWHFFLYDPLATLGDLEESTVTPSGCPKWPHAVWESTYSVLSSSLSFLYFFCSLLCVVYCVVLPIYLCAQLLYSLEEQKKFGEDGIKGLVRLFFFCLFHPFSSDSWYSCYSVNLWRFWHSFNLISARFKTLSNVGPLMWSITWFHSTFNATESLLENVWIPEDSLQFRPSWKIGLKLGWNLRGRGWDLNSFK